jgi:hypothetical protein
MTSYAGMYLSSCGGERRALLWIFRACGAKPRLSMAGMIRSSDQALLILTVLVIHKEVHKFAEKETKGRMSRRLSLRMWGI